MCIVYSYFRVPEPAGRSFAELDLLFEKKVSARKFASTQVNVFDETDVHGGVLDQAEHKLSISVAHDETPVHALGGDVQNRPVEK